MQNVSGTSCGIRCNLNQYLSNSISIELSCKNRIEHAFHKEIYRSDQGTVMETNKITSNSEIDHTRDSESHRSKISAEDFRGKKNGGTDSRESESTRESKNLKCAECCRIELLNKMQAKSASFKLHFNGIELQKPYQTCFSVSRFILFNNDGKIKGDLQIRSASRNATNKTTSNSEIYHQGFRSTQ